MPINNGFGEVAFQNDTMLAGDDFIMESGVVALGQNITRGQILGKITVSGELVALNAAATDGSQNAHSILAENVNATAASVTTTVYLAGEFKAAALLPTVTPAIKDALRALHIYAHPSV